MRSFCLTVTLANGQQQQHLGVFADGFAAVLCALDLFPDARRISALQLGVSA